MENIPDTYRTLCAKSDRNSRELWLPLWMHLVDTAETMEYLSCHWLSDSAKNAIGLKEDELRCYSRFLGYTHDLGKGTPLFQYQISQSNVNLRLKLDDSNWGMREEKLNPGKTGHALAGEAILQYLGCPESVALIVGAHHGKPSDKGQAAKENWLSYPWNYHVKDDGTDQWDQFWRYWLSYSLKYAGYAGLSDLPDVHMRAQMLLSGLLIMADWIASNTYYFPLIDLDKNPESTVYPLRTERAFGRLGFPEKSVENRAIQTFSDFKNRFGFVPNSIQRMVIDVVSKSFEPGIFILEAQMGIGKTEAALAAVEICAAKAGSDGFFFGLPTQATADGIFPRLSQWGGKLSEQSSHTIRLVHGMAEFNEQYNSLKEGSLNINDDSTDIYGWEEQNRGLLVHEWFSGRKKALLADYVVGTVDQLLMADLKQKHVMLRHLGLAGKIAVIDECHAYDAYMNQYLQGTLRWLGAYKIPVILLSATLPAARREELLRAYTGSKTLVGDFKTGCRDYPLLTWSDQSTVNQRTVPMASERNLSVEIQWEKDENIVGILKDELRDGGCAGIIVNTVRRAQRIYEELSSCMTEVRIILCHAQMLAPDRLNKEKALIAAVGKESDISDRSHVIVIGTSVLEQSLDIDFDVLYSDLCPMDLLLQRIGRLHRHRHHDSIRTNRLRTPVCHVLCGTGDVLDEGACRIYGEYLLLRTKAILPNMVCIPDNIPDLVQDVYDDNNDFGLTGKEYEVAKARYLLKIGKKEHKAAVYQLTNPDMKEQYNRWKSLRGLLSERIADRDSRAEAAVRDIGSSIDVLLLMRDAEGEIRYLPWQNGGNCVPTYCIPAVEECKAIARQRIRLPHRFCHEGIIDQTIKELEDTYREYFYEWKESTWLGRELILLLNEQLSAELDGTIVQYSFEEGLICRKEEHT